MPIYDQALKHNTVAMSFSGNLSKPSWDRWIELPDNAFQKEVLAVLPRYFCNPGGVYTSETVTAKGRPIDFKRSFPDEYEQWRNVYLSWEKRRIIYTVLDRILGHTLKPWQTAERLIDDRYAEIALKILRDAPGEPDADTCAAYGKASFVLTDYTAALRWANKGIALDARHLRSHRVLADTLYVLNRQKEALEVYQEITRLAIALRTESGEQKDEYDFFDMLSFNGNMVNCPVFACTTLHEQQASNAVWDWCEGEFYFSPQYRVQHAFTLVRRKEPVQALSRLMSLVNEMPWYKEGVLNCLALLEGIDRNGKYDAEKQKLQYIIFSNQWTAEDMFVVDMNEE